MSIAGKISRERISVNSKAARDNTKHLHVKDNVFHNSTSQTGGHCYSTLSGDMQIPHKFTNFGNSVMVVC
jgi:hypothetical protein